MMKPLTSDEFDEVMDSVNTTTAIRDRCFLGLSYYAGLAPKEMANLYLEDICDVNGQLVDEIQITSRGCSCKQPRRLPMVPRLRALLLEHIANESISSGPLFYTCRGTATTANAIKVQLWRIYKAAGFPGGSSYSGRRSFGLLASRVAGKAGRGPRDIAAMLGLARIASIEKYSDATEEQSKVVQAVEELDRGANFRAEGSIAHEFEPDGAE